MLYVTHHFLGMFFCDGQFFFDFQALARVVLFRTAGVVQFPAARASAVAIDRHRENRLRVAVHLAPKQTLRHVALDQILRVGAAENFIKIKNK